jgi:putative acetyltransferase
MMTIRESVPADAATLVGIWLRSVRVTHTFLTEDDIQALLPFVQEELGSPADLELWILARDDGTPIGFLGLSGADVAALFLVDHARALKGRLTVDVNEQNREAVRFYEAQGFRVVGRSPTDDAGRPFPLLHMRQAEA